MAARDKIIEKIIERLKTLAKSKFSCKEELRVVKVAAQDFFFEVFEVGISNTTFTYEEKRTIGPLVPPALRDLGYGLTILEGMFSSGSIDSARIERSGLQFFIDTFKDFPASTEDGSESLEKTIDEFLYHEDVDAIDRHLKTAASFDDCFDFPRSPSFEAEIAKLPSTHWWFRN